MPHRLYTLKSILFTGSLTFILGTCHAYEFDQAKNNLAHDLAHCSAYFTVIAEMKGLPAKTKADFQEVGFQLFSASTQLTNSQAAKARVSLSIKEMSQKLDMKAENWSILINENDALCKGIAVNPESRMQYWLDKK